MCIRDRDDGHLQQGLHPVADLVGGGAVEGLGAVAALEHELSLIHISEPTRPY